MRTSRFWELVEGEFGDSYGAVLVQDVVLGECGDVTGAAALSRGDDPRDVWEALCRAMEVPKSRWAGIDRPQRGHPERWPGR